MSNTKKKYIIKAIFCSLIFFPSIALAGEATAPASSKTWTGYITDKTWEGAKYILKGSTITPKSDVKKDKIKMHESTAPIKTFDVAPSYLELNNFAITAFLYTAIFSYFNKSGAAGLDSLVSATGCRTPDMENFSYVQNTTFERKGADYAFCALFLFSLYRVVTLKFDLITMRSTVRVSPESTIDDYDLKTANNIKIFLLSLMSVSFSPLFIIPATLYTLFGKENLTDDYYAIALNLALIPTGFYCGKLLLIIPTLFFILKTLESQKSTTSTTESKIDTKYDEIIISIKGKKEKIEDPFKKIAQDVVDKEWFANEATKSGANKTNFTNMITYAVSCFYIMNYLNPISTPNQINTNNMMSNIILSTAIAFMLFQLETIRINYYKDAHEFIKVITDHIKDIALFYTSPVAALIQGNISDHMYLMIDFGVTLALLKGIMDVRESIIGLEDSSIPMGSFGFYISLFYGTYIISKMITKLEYYANSHREYVNKIVQICKNGISISKPSVTALSVPKSAAYILKVIQIAKNSEDKFRQKAKDKFKNITGMDYESKYDKISYEELLHCHIDYEDIFWSKKPDDLEKDIQAAIDTEHAKNPTVPLDEQTKIKVEKAVLQKKKETTFIDEKMKKKIKKFYENNDKYKISILTETLEKELKDIKKDKEEQDKDLHKAKNKSNAADRENVILAEEKDALEKNKKHMKNLKEIFEKIEADTKEEKLEIDDKKNNNYMLDELVNKIPSAGSSK